MLSQEFENLKQRSSSSAEEGLQVVQDQFDCLVRALVMSTFAFKPMRSVEAQPVDGGGGNHSGGGGQGKGGEGGKAGRRSERGRKDASSAWNDLCDEDERLLRRVGCSWCRGYFVNR